MSESRKSSQPDRLKNLLYKFVDNPKDNEFEIRFGTKGIKRISKNDFDNVVQYLKSKNFTSRGEQTTLKIRSEFTDPKTGRSRISNIRTEVNGKFSIREICKHKTNSPLDNENVRYGVEFIQKSSYKNEDGTTLRPVDFDEFNFRATLQAEKKMSQTSGLVKQLLNDWDDKKKIFRLVNRYSFVNPNVGGVRVDMSVVQHSKKNAKGNMVPTYNIRESEIFESQKVYEIEIEVTPASWYTKEAMLAELRNTIKYVLCGLQQTNYPIAYNEMREVATEYMKMVYGDEHPNRMLSRNFIGPSSISLELKNVQPISEDSIVANIRNPYTVTEKADGLRKLLFVNSKGRIYLIDTNMNVQFTGMITKSEEHFNSMLDGEHILHDKHGDYLNMYAAFDIYFIDGQDQRLKKFVNHTTSDEESSNFRLNLLDTFVNTLKPKHIVAGGNILVIDRKVFEVSPNEDSIFNACKKIYEREESGMYSYETDGLIFTPCDLGVGLTYGDKEPINNKHTWLHSFKWKPPQYNTIDFLVTTIKSETGTDMVNSIFEEGIDMSTGKQYKQYKTLVLRVGFDERKHGYVNPCNDIIMNKLPSSSAGDDTDGYRPMPFHPTNPSINKAYLCNIMVNENVDGNLHMFVEDGSDEILDETIVEFKYIKDAELGWNWVPIRVRHDKTAEYRNGIKNYGNAYHVAQSVWSSIHHPITKEMITTGIDIPEVEEDVDVYYNKYGKSLTKPLRDFHNLYVKNKLITGVARRGGTLIDLAVGKGGDIPKWISAKLKFVLGIDVSKDNIENRLDGACARYLNYSKRFSQMPKALFINGNSKLHIRSGEALVSEKGKEIMNAVIGKGPKDKSKLGAGVYNQYSVGKDGFNVVSCQFAIHYFFENPETLHTFLQNVSENCKEGGYFIGTSYDGKHIFNALKDKDVGESIYEYKDDKKIWEIRKGYEQETFTSDDSSIGLAIDVYQETINKVFREYLVNYEYLTELMRTYGFELVTKEEANKMKLPNSTGMFNELYSQMANDIRRQKRSKKGSKSELELEVGTALELDDDSQQKRVSFLNRYFIYKKVANVNAEQIKNTMLGKSYQAEARVEEVESEKVQDVAEKAVEAEKPKKLKIKKLKGRKLKLKAKPADE